MPPPPFVLIMNSYLILTTCTVKSNHKASSVLSSCWLAHILEGDFFCVCAAAGSANRSRSGPPQDWAPSAEDQETESVSVKERLAMYQAAVTKKDTSSSSSAAVRRYFHTDVTGDGGEDMQAAREAGREESGDVFRSNLLE